jgi:tetratricopeptide (TPR) repeat protein
MWTERRVVLSVGLVATVALAAPEVPTPTREAMAELQKIEAAGYHDQIAPLRLKYDELIKQSPGHVMPRVYLAWCTLPSDDAWNQLKGVTFLAPKNPWARYGMGRIYMAWRSMISQAKGEFELALEADAQFYPALVGLGDLARLKKDWAAAEAKYRAALALSDDAFARAGLGLSLAAQGKNDEARGELKRAIALMPEQPGALEVLVRLEQEAKDPDLGKALAAWVSVRPRDRIARKALADQLFEASDKAAAAREYDALVRLGDPDVLSLRRLAALDRELHDAAGEEWATLFLSGLEKQDSDATLRLAELRLARKDLEGAEAAWRMTLERDACRFEAWEGLARLHRARGELYEALLAYRKAVASDPGRAEAAAQVEQLSRDFKLPKRRPRGNVNSVYWAVEASAGKFYEERKATNPALKGTLRLRVRVRQDGSVEGVDIVEDTLKDPLLQGHVYFSLLDAEYAKQKADPTFEFGLGAKGKGK